MSQTTEIERDRELRARGSLPLAGVVGVVGLILAVAAVANPVLLAAGLAVCAVIIAWGWAGTFGLPSPRGTLGVVLIGGLTLVGAVAVQDSQPWLVWVPAALALSMIAAFLHQLMRRDGRPRVVQSVSAVVLGLTLVACGVLMIPASHTAEGIALLLAALAAAVASSLTDVLSRFAVLRPWLAALAMIGGGAVAVAIAVGLNGDPTTWLLVGVAAGALSQALRGVFGGLPTLTHARPRLVVGVASVLVVGLVPYLVALTFLPVALIR